MDSFDILEVRKIFWLTQYLRKTAPASYLGHRVNHP